MRHARARSLWHPPLLNEAGEANYYLDTQLYPIKPFAEIQFFYHFHFQDREEQLSETFSFIYEDNRFDWEYMEDDLFQVFWYGGDLNLGQTILNVAISGLYSAQTYLPIADEFPIRIYAFKNANDLQTSLLLTQEDWVAGHASPELGVILISAPEGPVCALINACWARTISLCAAVELP